MLVAATATRLITPPERPPVEDRQTRATAVLPLVCFLLRWRRQDLQTPDTACPDPSTLNGTAALHASGSLRTWFTRSLAQDTGTVRSIWLAQAGVAQDWASLIGWAGSRAAEPAGYPQSLTRGSC